MKKTVANNTLNQLEVFKLMDWLSKNKDRIHQKMGASEIAKEATRALGFTITPGNIATSTNYLEIATKQPVKTLLGQWSKTHSNLREEIFKEIESLREQMAALQKQNEELLRMVSENDSLIQKLLAR